MTLEEQVKFLTAENRAKDELIELLQQKLDYVLRQLHSPKSEKFDPNQLTLLDDESKKSRSLLRRNIRPGGGQHKRRNKGR